MRPPGKNTRLGISVDFGAFGFYFGSRLGDRSVIRFSFFEEPADDTGLFSSPRAGRRFCFTAATRGRWRRFMLGGLFVIAHSLE